jgi:hypothetical protein
MQMYIFGSGSNQLGMVSAPGAQTKLVEEMKTQILCSTTFFLIRAVYDTTWRNMAEGTDENMARSHCMLDN